jgi:nuclear pore complex protein Nup98-Nup96
MLDEGVVQLTKLHLTAVENVRPVKLMLIQDAAVKQAVNLLEKQLENTTFTTEHGIPIAIPSPQLQFCNFISNPNSQISSIRQIDEYEIHLWHLSSILFDDLPTHIDDKSHRKRELSTFFKELVSRSVWTDISRSRDPAERIFLNLTGYRIQDACNEATKIKDLHLATLLALSEESTDQFRQDLQKQLETWKKDFSLRYIQPWYQAIYEVLAGQLDSGIALSQLGVGERLDWRRAFAMRLWFSTPSDGQIKEAVEEYWMACQQNISISKPIPWYSADRETRVYDGLFHILRLFSSSGINSILDDALNPYNFSSALTDVRVPWHLYAILSLLQNRAKFSDTYGSSSKAISDTGERLTLSYVSQLENLNLWQWAIFVGLHLQRENTRKGIIMNILARNLYTIEDPLEEQGVTSRFVEQWKIPMEWILEAKVSTFLSN